MLEIAAASFDTFFVIVDPLAVAPIFIGLTDGASDSDRRNVAIKATLVAATVLVVFAVAGEILLKSLGITLAAFRIAGGLLLFILAVEMVFAHHSGIRSTTTVEEQEARTKKDVSVFPLGIPLIAGPGAMASTILLIGEHADSLLRQGVVVLVMLAVLALSLMILLLSVRIVRYLGVTGVNVVTRVFGIVLGALAVQYVIDGLRESFATLA